MKEIVVTGSRRFTDWELVYYSMAEEVWGASEPIRIILGDCPTGADFFAKQYCYAISTTTDWDFHYEILEADWAAFGSAAGPMRNRRMCNSVLDREHAVCLSFPDDASRGTLDCSKYAKQCDIRLRFPQLKDDWNPMKGSWQEWAVKLLKED